MSVLASVIIPNCRPESLANCLQGLRASSLPASQFEIIVVDDGSPEPLEPIALRFGARSLRQPNSVPDPAWLPTLLAVHPADVLYGHVANGLPQNPCAEASQQLLHCIYDYLTRHPRGVNEAAFSPFATTNNLALSRARFHRAGGFNTAFRLAAAEDREFCARWLRQGWHLRSVPDATVHHFHDLTLAGFCRQHQPYGRGSQQVRGERALPGQGGQKIEPFAVYSSLIAISQAAMATGVLRQMFVPKTPAIHSA
jgi:glycosyltransferase involved in cell wall biosynthesis